MEQRQRLAVLIDGENISTKIAARVFGEIAELGDACVRRVYADFTRTNLQPWKDFVTNHALVAHQNFPCAAKKNATDIAMVVDAMDLLHSRLFDGFCIVSSDSDFCRLASRIREEGLFVYGFGRDNPASPSFKNACHQFFDVAKFDPKKAPVPVAKK